MSVSIILFTIFDVYKLVTCNQITSHQSLTEEEEEEDDDEEEEEDDDEE